MQRSTANRFTKAATRRHLTLAAALILLATALFLRGGDAHTAYAAGSDFKSIDFVGAAPTTYDHTVGGGAYDDATVGDSADIVRQLEGGRFACNDVVSFLLAIQMNTKTSVPVQSAEFDLRFLANTTGRSGAAVSNITAAKINYGTVPGGDGAGGKDSGMRDDGGSYLTVVSKGLTGPLYGDKSELLATLRVSDLEAGEQVIVRIDTRLSCQPESDPTGNLQASIHAARVYGTNDAINAGNQTIPFMHVEEVAGTGEPLLNLNKTVTPAGTSCKNAADSLKTYPNQQVKYCYTVTNNGTQELLDVTVKDNNATPGNTADDITVKLNNTQNVDGQNDAPDINAVTTSTGETTVTIPSTGTIVTTATATGNNGGAGGGYADLTKTDTATVVSDPVPTELTWDSKTYTVAYEDLKNAGWSDWDYNDLIVRMTVKRGINYQNSISKIVVEYEALARGANFNHKFIHKLPLVGGGTADIVVKDAGGKVLRQETVTFGALASFGIFDKTRDALPPLPGFFDTNTRRSQTSVVRGYTATLTITPASAAANPAASMAPAPWDPYIWVYNTNQEVHLVIPGQLNNTQTVNAKYDAASPLIGFDLPLAQLFPSDWQWPIEFAGIWRGYPAYSKYIFSGGSTDTNWYLPQRANKSWLWTVARLGEKDPEVNAPAEEAIVSRYFASPVVADLENDGQPEIIIGNLMTNQVEVYGSLRQMRPGWPQSIGGGVKAAVAVADLNDDGALEVLAGASDGKVYAWTANGSPLAGWPATLDPAFRVLATPAVGDIDGDGQVDVVVPLSNGKLYALQANGQLKAGWPISLGGVQDSYNSQVINSSPRIADIDGDGQVEIVIGSTDRKVYAFNGDGSVQWIFGTGDMVFSTPVVADIDPAAAGLETAFGSGDSYFYVLDSNGELLWKRPTGWTLRASPSAADLDGDGTLELFIGGDDDKVWGWRNDGTPLDGWPQSTGGDVFAPVTVADTDGDGVAEVAAGSDDAHVYIWHANGQTVSGWPRPTALPVKGATLLVNLDGDPELEVVAADFSGRLYTWGVEAHTVFMPMASR